MTDEPRDELDRALASRLGSLADGDDDATAILENMRPGLRRARTRHRAARASAAVFALAIVVSLTAVLSSSATHHGKVAVQSGPTTTVHPIVPNPKPKPPKTQDVTTTTRPGATTPTSASSGNPPTPVPAPTPGGNEGPGGPQGPGDGGTPPTVAAPQTHTYSAPGGTLTVECSSAGLQLLSYTANSTWTGGVHTDNSQEIEVRFSRSSSGIEGGGQDSSASEDGQSRIDVKLNGGCAFLEVQTQ